MRTCPKGSKEVWPDESWAAEAKRCSHFPKRFLHRADSLGTGDAVPRLWWLSREARSLLDACQAGFLQSQLDAALVSQWDNTAENVVTIRVPAGTTIYGGFAAPQSTGVGQLLGGGSKVYIQGVDPIWVVP